MTGPHEDPEGDSLVPLSALNAFLYCDRRAALRHLDGLYVHNEHTRQGDRLHARADRPGFERRRGVRTERGLWIASRRLGLYGRADLVEFRRAPGTRKPRDSPAVEVPLPVEYKRGKRRRWENDDVQLCAQALCLEEMLGVAVPLGAVYHERSKARREVEFTVELRERTEAVVAGLHALLRRCAARHPEAPVSRLFAARPLPARGVRPPRSPRRPAPRPLPRPAVLTRPDSSHEPPASARGAEGNDGPPA